MATTTQQLSEEQIDQIIQGVHAGWLDDITLESPTDADPFRRVVLSGHQWNPRGKGFEEVRVVLGEFRQKPDCCLRTFKKADRAAITLYREAKMVRRVALQAAILQSKRRAA